jgi:hypothetical protein
MKHALIALLLLAGPLLPAQEQQPEPLYKKVRQLVFGEYYPVQDLNALKLGDHALVAFSNGYVIEDTEFRNAFFATERSDTSAAAKTKFLNEYILGRQKTFEGMDMDLDSSSRFMLEYIQYKQTLITPYLNAGKTRIEAEELPEVKYALRRQYAGMVQFELMSQEVWSKSNNTVVLREFYNNHLGLYQGQSFEISRTKVVHDYQKELETELNARVQSRFPYKINQELQAKL